MRLDVTNVMPECTDHKSEDFDRLGTGEEHHRIRLPQPGVSLVHLDNLDKPETSPYHIISSLTWSIPLSQALQFVIA